MIFPACNDRMGNPGRCIIRKCVIVSVKRNQYTVERKSGTLFRFQDICDFRAVKSTNSRLSLPGQMAKITIDKGIKIPV